MRVGLGIYRGESRGRGGIGGRDEEGDGIGGMVISAEKVAEMASTNQFFNFILECFTFLCGMAVVSVIAIVFSHVRVSGVDVLRGGGMRSACKASSRRRDLGYLGEVVEWGWQ